MNFKRLALVGLAAATILSACGSSESSRQRNAELPTESSSTSSSIEANSSTSAPATSSTVASGPNTTVAGFNKSWVALTWKSTNTTTNKDTLIVRYAKPSGASVAGK
ncbi:MAG: hypothetical protein RJA15_1296, partial [Actinomycetota bacterium]